MAKVEDFLGLSWHAEEAQLIDPPFASPLIADPSFLFPEETSGEWVLYAHSAWGLHEYRSLDGKDWHHCGLKVANAMRPFIRKLSNGGYILLYEKTRALAVPSQILPYKPKWDSTIELRRSQDLTGWSDPITIMTPQLDWMRDNRLGNSVSNPCLLEGSSGLTLFFSASLSWIDDCGFCEPKYIASAKSRNLESPFVPEPEPTISPGDGQLGAGSIKVIQLSNGFIGLQNKIFRDSEGKSRSAIFVLSSDDGVHWKNAKEEPIVKPDSGWKASHVYACDCRYRESFGTWYLYFNARDTWSMSKGRERIGRVIASRSE